MRAISKEPVGYVCKSDRGLPRKEQTVFYIVPKTYQEVNKAMGRYGGTFKEEADGRKIYDVPKLNEADQQEWNDVLAKIENFSFTDKYYTENPDMATKAVDVKLEEGGKAKFVPLIEDGPTKIAVLKSLPANVVNEIWRASQDVSLLKEGEKNG